MSFEGKVVIVTGGNSGIGEATSELLVKEGANVIIVGRDETKLKNVSEKCSQLGKKPFTIKADIADDKNVNRIIEEAIEKFGKIDVLINNAGILRATDILEDNFMELHDTLMKVNYRAVVLLSKLAIPYLIKTKGNIVNISSVSSMNFTIPHFMAYKTTKAALDFFTKSLALEVGCKGVRVNSVNPGSVKTNIFDAGGVSSDEERLKNFSLLNRISQPEEIAEIILFLASDKAKSVTGSLYVIDNGALLK